MAPDVKAVHLKVQIETGADADPEELDRLTRRLRDEIRELEVESVELAEGGTAPPGAKSAEAVTLGALAVVVLPTVLPKLVEFLQAWAMRGQARTLKFKGKISGEQIEIEGATLEELKALLAGLPVSQAAEVKTAKKTRSRGLPKS